MIKQTINYVVLSLGFLSILLGIVGVLMPIMPGIPFFFLAAYCFSRSSPRIHQWLLKQLHKFKKFSA